MFSVLISVALNLACSSLLAHEPVSTAPRALRICRPPPPANNNISGKYATMLVIGDSVSLGYTPDVAAQILNATGGKVLHAPFSGDGGACDTSYALTCLPLWLNSSLGGGTTPKYDAILFNFGLHDTNDSDMDEESRDEFVPLEKYGQNLQQIRSLIQQFQPQAQVGYLLTTPMHFDMHLNDNVKAYNEMATKVLLTGPSAVKYSADLYSTVVKVCGEPPYAQQPTNCSLINDNEEYHYNAKGYSLLSKAVADLFEEMLKGKKSHDFAQRAVAVEDDVVMCSDGITHCPASMTCAQDHFSAKPSSMGCCPAPDAVDCGDAWHCCPTRTTCTKNECTVALIAPISPVTCTHAAEWAEDICDMRT